MFYLSEFTLDNLLNIANALPDELVATSDNNNPGTLDTPSLETTSQNQLSQLLSSSTPTPQPSVSSIINSIAASPQNQNAGRSPGVGTMANANVNAVKSPHTNNMSPVHGAVGKGGPMNPQNMMSMSDSNLQNSGFSLVSSAGGTNMGTVKPMTSQLLSVSNVNMSQHNPNQLMNGPHYSTSGMGQARNIPSSSIGNANAISMQQGPGNVMGTSLNMSQLPGHQNMGHPGLGSSQAQQQLVKVCNTFV